MNKIEVKNVKIADFLSEETLAYTATVYENGKKIGTAKNEGCGGNTFIYLDDPRSRTLEEESALEEKVDELVYEIDAARQKAKVLLKVNRDTAKYICVGTITDVRASYWTQGFKPARPLAELATLKGGLDAIQRMYDRIKSELEGDEKILNTNLEALGVKI